MNKLQLCWWFEPELFQVCTSIFCLCVPSRPTARSLFVFCCLYLHHINSWWNVFLSFCCRDGVNTKIGLEHLVSSSWFQFHPLKTCTHTHTRLIHWVWNQSQTGWVFFRYWSKHSIFLISLSQLYIFPHTHTQVLHSVPFEAQCTLQGSFLPPSSSDWTLALSSPIFPRSEDPRSPLHPPPTSFLSWDNP